MDGDRLILRADRSGFTYGDLLEVTAGHARLLVPSRWRRRWLRLGLSLPAVAWLFGTGLLIGLNWSGIWDWLARFLGALEAEILLLSIPWVGALVLAWIADRRLPYLLARQPDETLDLQLLGMEDFKTFQELRAMAGTGQLRITVQGSRRRVSDALRRAGVPVVAGESGAVGT